MSIIPAFELGLWNAWILIAPFLLVNYGLCFFIVDKKATLFVWPSYTKTEKRLLAILMVIMFGSWIYSLFVPLKIGTAWFYTTLPIYLAGIVFITMAMVSFATTSLDEPNTTGIYRISRHPMNFGWLLIYLGIGMASASWVYLLVALVFLLMYKSIIAIPEERMCCEKFGNAYREYMRRTPRWIGIPKSGKK